METSPASPLTAARKHERVVVLENVNLQTSTGLMDPHCLTTSNLLYFSTATFYFQHVWLPQLTCRSQVLRTNVITDVDSKEERRQRLSKFKGSTKPKNDIRVTMLWNSYRIY